MPNNTFQVKDIHNLKIPKANEKLENIFNYQFCYWT